MNDGTTRRERGAVGPLDIVVTGATGQQGGALAASLLDKGHRVRALTRNPQGERARALADRGADIRRADLDTGSGLDDALAGATVAFLVTTPFERGARAELVQAEHFGRAASRAGIEHLIYSSVTLPMTYSPIEHFAAKGEAERLLAELGSPLTIIGAPPFLDNVIAGWHLPWLRRGVFALPVADVAMPMVLTRDIAAVAHYLIEHRDAFVGERVDIATEAITGEQIKRTIETASGRSFQTETKTFAELDPMLGKLFSGIEVGARSAPEGAGPTVDIAAIRARLPGVRWSSFSAWAAEQDWTALLER